MRRIYLDNNATTFVDSDVIKVVCDTLTHFPGNPSSTHFYGRESKSLLIKARATISSYLNVRPKEIAFTSNGTEGANLIIRGLLGSSKNSHVITSSVEHAAVYSTLKAMIKDDLEVTFINPGPFGAVSSADIIKAIKPNTKLIALMAVNNETGVKTDIECIAQIASQNKIPFFVDGVALMGKEEFIIPEGVSAMSFSGHKFHAPKGCGFVYIKSNLKLAPQITGGEQEYNRRAGTENLADIAAMAEAVRLLREKLPDASKKMLELRTYFENSLKSHLGDKIAINGDGPRVCNTVNIAFLGVDGETLLTALDIRGIAASHGSACASGAIEPSRVLLNMGYSMERVISSIRFSISRYTTKEELDYSIDVICKTLDPIYTGSRV